MTDFEKKKSVDPVLSKGLCAKQKKFTFVINAWIKSNPEKNMNTIFVFGIEKCIH